MATDMIWTTGGLVSFGKCYGGSSALIGTLCMMVAKNGKHKCTNCGFIQGIWTGVFPVIYGMVASSRYPATVDVAGCKVRNCRQDIALEEHAQSWTSIEEAVNFGLESSGNEFNLIELNVTNDLSTVYVNPASATSAFIKLFRYDVLVDDIMTRSTIAFETQWDIEQPSSYGFWYWPISTTLDSVCAMIA